MKRRQSGFTLIELMVALTVLSILMGLAIPMFREVTQSNRVIAAQNDLVSALNLARSEAIKRSTTIEVCASTDGTTCSGSANWTGGWIVQQQSPVLKLQGWGSIDGNVTAIGPAGSLVYQPTGIVDAAGTFDVAYAGCTGRRMKRVSVTLVGSPHSETRSCT